VALLFCVLLFSVAVQCCCSVLPFSAASVHVRAMLRSSIAVSAIPDLMTTVEV
jgi:hypothetical protein